MFDQFLTWLAAALLAMGAAMHPWAAAGAAFGCCFYLGAPSATKGRQRVYLLFFSLGFGYSWGTFLYGGGPPWSEKAMAVSAVASALGAVLMTAFYFIIDKKGSLPDWLESLLDRVPMLKRRRTQDGD